MKLLILALYAGEGEGGLANAPAADVAGLIRDSVRNAVRSSTDSSVSRGKPDHAESGIIAKSALIDVRNTSTQLSAVASLASIKLRLPKTVLMGLKMGGFLPAGGYKCADDWFESAICRAEPPAGSIAGYRSLDHGLAVEVSPLDDGDMLLLLPASIDIELLSSSPSDSPVLAALRDTVLPLGTGYFTAERVATLTKAASAIPNSGNIGPSGLDGAANALGVKRSRNEGNMSDINLFKGQELTGQAVKASSKSSHSSKNEESKHDEHHATDAASPERMQKVSTLANYLLTVLEKSRKGYNWGQQSNNDASADTSSCEDTWVDITEEDDSDQHEEDDKSDYEDGDEGDAEDDNADPNPSDANPTPPDAQTNPLDAQASTNATQSNDTGSAQIEAPKASEKAKHPRRGTHRDPLGLAENNEADQPDHHSDAEWADELIVEGHTISDDEDDDLSLVGDHFASIDGIGEAFDNFCDYAQFLISLRGSPSDADRRLLQQLMLLLPALPARVGGRDDGRALRAGADAVEARGPSEKEVIAVQVPMMLKHSIEHCLLLYQQLGRPVGNVYKGYGKEGTASDEELAAIIESASKATSVPLITRPMPSPDLLPSLKEMQTFLEVMKHNPAVVLAPLSALAPRFFEYLTTRQEFIGSLLAAIEEVSELRSFGHALQGQTAASNSQDLIEQGSMLLLLAFRAEEEDKVLLEAPLRDVEEEWEDTDGSDQSEPAQQETTAIGPDQNAEAASHARQQEILTGQQLLPLNEEDEANLATLMSLSNAPRELAIRAYCTAGRLLDQAATILLDWLQ